MRNECNIIRDLLPLYVEKLASEDSAALIEEHLLHCTDCRAELARMRSPDPAELAEPNTPEDGGEQPLRAFRKRWKQRRRRMIGVTALVTALVVLFASYFLGSGLNKRTDVMLLDYSVSEDGTTLTLHTAVAGSMGYTRGFHDKGGGVKPHYLVFYSTFGGLNSSLGARQEFTLTLDETDSEVYFNRADGGYALVLQKDAVSGAWTRPSA